MRYFLKKSEPSKKGLYLQIYKSAYIPGKGGRNSSHKAIGYVSDLKKNGIKDPMAYAMRMVDELNAGLPKETEKKVGDVSLKKNLGHFLAKSMWDHLGAGPDYNAISSSRAAHYEMSDFLQSMIYSQIVSPGSKRMAFERVMPSLLGEKAFSYDQILDGVNFIGQDYQKFIEVMNKHILCRFGRKSGKAYFDCTNYYFEIDLPKEGRQPGPSKEERHLPIIGQALLLDEEQIPLGMSLCPGNESEKPRLRESIEALRRRFGCEGKIVQIADKGPNCARNIYAACVEASDGYIFSKSFRGRGLSPAEKAWIRLEDGGENRWTDVIGEKGAVSYRYKECVDDSEYSFVGDGGEAVRFSVKEKRVVSYSPALARKQRAQIAKMADKARAMSSAKQRAKGEYGEAAKYVDFVESDENGVVLKPEPIVNEAKIEEDMAFAGYNLLVTSETGKTAKEIYEAYRGLWRIEESFRAMKTYLEARPVFLQTLESIYGHFTVCYLALTLLRLIELKVFKDEVPLGRIVDFIRELSVTVAADGTYVSNVMRSQTLKTVQKRYSLSKLDNAYLTKKDVSNILGAELYFE